MRGWTHNNECPVGFHNLNERLNTNNNRLDSPEIRRRQSSPWKLKGRDSAPWRGRRVHTCRTPGQPFLPQAEDRRGLPSWRSPATALSWGRSSQSLSLLLTEGRPQGLPPHMRGTGWTRSRWSPGRWWGLQSQAERKYNLLAF